jgi:hypothetical protein
MTTSRLWLIDVDGTLSAPSMGRLALLGDRDPNCLADASPHVIDAFMRPELVADDGPTPWCQAIVDMSTDGRRFFLSGRCEALRGVTVQWLARHGWPDAHGYLRPDNCKAATSISWKLFVLSMIDRQIGLHDAILIDDDAELLRIASDVYRKLEVMHAPSRFEHLA